MGTLLNLFFKPYLRFLLKFHLYAIGVAAGVFLVGIQEILVALPFIYYFALYTTMNRHQFKENISWMLSSFNKRTLITYHLVAQTLVLLCQALLGGLVFLAFLAVLILYAPEASQKVLPDMGSVAELQKASPASQLLTKGLSPLATTKEVLITVCIGFFFLLTIYSPISLNTYLRQLEEKSGSSAKRKKMWVILSVYFGFVLLGFTIELSDYLLPLLCLTIVAEIGYAVWMYNKAFVLFHPSKYRGASAMAAVAFVVLSVGVYQSSLKNFRTGPMSEVKLAELSFLGAFAPDVTPAELASIARDIKDPSVIVALIRSKRYGKLVPDSEIQRWALEAKDLGTAVALIQSLPLEKLGWINDDKSWQHLESLFQDLYSKNQVSAAWQARRLEKQLESRVYEPRAQELGKRGPLEQYVVMSWWKKHRPEELSKVMASELDPKVATLFRGDFTTPATKKRMPATNSGR